MITLAGITEWFEEARGKVEAEIMWILLCEMVVSWTGWWHDR